MAMPRGGGLRSARLTSSGGPGRSARRRLRNAALVALLAGAVASCATSGDSGSQPSPPAVKVGAQVRPIADAVTTGLATFEPMEGGLKASVTLYTGRPGKWRVVIHTTGICTSPNGFSAGPPLIPPGATEPPTILMTTTEDGMADTTVRLRGFTIDGPAGIVGRSVVVHYGASGSLDAQPGVRNDRTACGVIGTLKPVEF